MTKADDNTAAVVSGRCYCGATTISASEGVPILARCIREARTSNEAIGFDSLFRHQDQENAQ